MMGILDLLKIVGNEDHVSISIEDNYHGLFRYLESKNIDVEDLRKVFFDKNISVFSLLPDYESLRKAVVNPNINDIFKFVKGKEDLRKIADGNEHSHLEYLK